MSGEEDDGLRAVEVHLINGKVLRPDPLNEETIQKLYDLINDEGAKMYAGSAGDLLIIPVRQINYIRVNGWVTP